MRAPIAVALLASLAACAEAPKPPAVANVRYYYVDLNGQAQRCVAPADLPVTPAGTAEAQMELMNDGGWCGVTVAQVGPKPYDAGLLAARPAHGRVRVQTVGDKTRIDYIPDTGFSGADAFGVRLLPGGGTVRVAVTVTPGPVVTPAVAPAPPPTPPRARPRRP